MMVQALSNEKFDRYDRQTLHGDTDIGSQKIISPEKARMQKFYYLC
jgi:hypothetical protein